MDITGIESATNQQPRSRIASVKKKLLSDECLGFPMYFYELWLFSHKKIHICFGGYVTAGAGLEHNILIQY